MSFSNEGDSRRGGAAGDLCCLSMSSEGGVGSGGGGDADVKQPHLRFPPPVVKLCTTYDPLARASPPPTSTRPTK